MACSFSPTAGSTSGPTETPKSSPTKLLFAVTSVQDEDAHSCLGGLTRWPLSGRVFRMTFLGKLTPGTRRASTVGLVVSYKVVKHVKFVCVKLPDLL